MQNTAPWPDGVTARYLTIGGATVDLKDDESTTGYVDGGECTGCGHHIGWGRATFAREEAQRHAEKCRAMPRPAAN
jgi:hypothetical protein